MNNFGFEDRLAQSMAEMNLKQKDLVKITGVSKGTVSNWVSGKTKPIDTAIIDKLAVALKVNKNWLLTGAGAKKTTIKNVDKVDGAMRRIPVLNWVQAGEFTDVCDNTYDEYEYIYDDGSFSSYMYAVRVRGDSMEPLFYENDLLIVNQERKPRAGDYVIAIVDHDNQATFKRYKPCGLDPKTNKEYCQLVPLNDFYPTIDSRFTEFSIRGVVIKHERCLV